MQNSESDQNGEVLISNTAAVETVAVFRWLAKIIGQLNTANGWRDVKISKGERIALIHSEASELLEWTRGSEYSSDHIPTYSGEEEELADIVIRVIDYADVYDLSLGPALLAKLRFNKTRGYRHGGKKI